nr:ATP-binding protein [Kofleriaceae bacterium]
MTARELAQLGAALRRAADVRGGGVAERARAIVDAVWPALGAEIARVELRRGDAVLAARGARDAQALDSVAILASIGLPAPAQATLAGAPAALGDGDAVSFAVVARGEPDAARADALAAASTTLAAHAAIALAAAPDVGGDAPAIAAQRSRALEALLATHTDAWLGDVDTAADRLARTQRAMLNVIEDLRESRAQLETRVAERTRELASASRAKDEFLAMLGHELRNPLAPILTALELMRLRAGDALSRERAIIERQTQHLAGLLEDLLDVSRIARGLVELRRARVAIADVVARSLETAAPLIEQQRHDVAFDVPRELVVDGDAARLGQIFANLLTNAAKYTDAGGRIAVAASADGDDVAVSVTDNGRGISHELLPHVFDLFVQERQNIDRARGGLGLGLAIVRNLVQLHGGRIDAASAGPGRGSTFTVRLPRVAAIVEAPEPSLPVAAPQARAASGTVLVVDDNADAAVLLADLLESRGYTARVAHDPTEALRVAGEFVPDVAVLDIGLPDMDGYELARRLRALPAWRDVTLLALSGYGQEPDRARSADAGFAQHLVKPVDLATLSRYLP